VLSCFLNKPVEDENWNIVLEAARWLLSRNLQECASVVVPIGNKKKFSEISDKTICSK
jgi:hypothetical protein